MTAYDEHIMKRHLETVQGVLHIVNPFVINFKQILDIPAEDLQESKIVIKANDRTNKEYARVCNVFCKLQEVRVATNMQPQTFVIQPRVGEM